MLGVTRHDSSVPSELLTWRQSSLALTANNNQQPRLAVSGVLFEMYGVFFDATAWRRWLLQLLSRIGLHTHYNTFYGVWEREHEVAVNCGKCDYWEALRGYLRSAGLSRGQIEEVTAAGMARHRHFEEGVLPFPRVSSTIASLASQGLQLAVFSNSRHSSGHLMEKLQQMGIGSYFSIVMSSRDLGVAKPAPESYHAVALAMRLPLEEVVTVSHCEMDLVGARDVGMPSIAIKAGHEVTADIQLDRFDQLLDHLEPRCMTAMAG